VGHFQNVGPKGIFVYKCLIVEDSALLRRIFGKMLHHLGFETVMAANVKEAQDLCASALPDLALVDWNLPDKDGIDFVRFLRELLGGERPKVMMCTIENSPAQIEKALALGADDYLMKPFTVDMLESKLITLGFDGGDDAGSGLAPASAPKEIAANLSRSHRDRHHLSRLAITAMTLGERDAQYFEAGSVIFRQGDTADYAYVLTSGAVRISVERAGVPMILEDMNPFEMFGELALLGNSARAVTASALEDCEVLRFDLARLKGELDNLSPFARNWIDTLADRVTLLVSKLGSGDF
jgi:two-component system chemotaxis response regulator CheY